MLSQRRLDAVEADNRRLMQDVYGLRQTNHMLNERVSAIVKRAAAAGDANKVLSARLINAERERDASRAMLEAERQHSKDMEGLAQQARSDVIIQEIRHNRDRAAVTTTASGDRYPFPPFPPLLPYFLFHNTILTIILLPLCPLLQYA